MDRARQRDGVPLRVTSGIVLRVVSPLIMVSALLMAVGAASAWYVHRLQKNVTNLMTQDVSSIRAAEELEITVRQIEAHMDQYLLTGAREHLDAIPAHREETERWLGEAERLVATDRERSLLASIRAAHGRFWESIDRARRRTDSGEIKRVVYETILGMLTEGILVPSQLYLDSREREVAADSAQNQAMPSRVALVLLLLGICGALAGLLAGLGIARAINRSIAQLSIPIRDAAGKLSEVVGPITLSPAWDLESLESVLRKVADQIGTVVERLEISRREALRAEQLAALGQIAAGLAHELRNPLTAMKMLVQSAVERGDAAGLRGRPLRVLEEEIDRLERSIQEFLDFARPPEVEKRTFAFAQLLDQILVLVSAQAAQKSVGIAREVPDGPITVEADMGQIRQVLLNLLLNAIDATPAGGTIRVRVRREHAGGEHWLAVRVADQGCGLPADLGDRIFEPFVSTKETGLGLGLSICKRIVEAHGGRIDAAGRPGGETVFTVQLPLGAAGESPAATGEPPALDDAVIRYN